MTLGQALYGEPAPPGPWSTSVVHTAARPGAGADGVGPRAAYRRLADELTRAAPLAVFGSWVWSEYFSPRVGCKVFQARYGVVDLGVLCKT